MCWRVLGRLWFNFFLFVCLFICCLFVFSWTECLVFFISRPKARCSESQKAHSPPLLLPSCVASNWLFTPFIILAADPFSLLHTCLALTPVPFLLSDLATTPSQRRQTHEPRRGVVSKDLPCFPFTLCEYLARTVTDTDIL